MASKPKVISVCHAPAESPWGRDVYGRSSGIDHWVAVSELALEAIPIAARESTPTSVIWNAVDASRMTVTRSREEMHARWGLPPGAKVAGFLGRLSAEKDPHALRRMIDHLPDDWHAVLVGAGFEYVKPHERLHLVGNDPLAGDVLGAFDTLIVPSHYESFCLVMGEAWWSGLAVVSTDVGLSRMSPGLTRTIPVGSSGEAVANAVLLDLIDTSGVADRIGRAFRFARERLSPDRFGREWTTLIRSLVPPTLAERLSCVRECPDRGNVLPISMQPEGCSKCGEKSECRSGKGEIPGRVSLRECLECVDLAGIVRKTN
jgi:glycosyltransferase involved in cell wall biosynthesis